MAIRSIIRRDQKPRDSRLITIKMISTKKRNSGIQKRKKVTTRNMVANMNFMIRKRANIRKAKRRKKVMMKDTKVSTDQNFFFQISSGINLSIFILI